MTKGNYTEIKPDKFLYMDYFVRRAIEFANLL